MKKIADYFGVSIDYLMTGKESNDENTSTEKDYAKNETERKLLVLCRKQTTFLRKNAKISLISLRIHLIYT